MSSARPSATVRFSAVGIFRSTSPSLTSPLAQPTLNRSVAAPLAAHLLALEALVLRPERWTPGVHPLPAEMDDWVVRSWRGGGAGGGGGGGPGGGGGGGGGG